MRYVILPACLGLPQGLLPVGRARKISQGSAQEASWAAYSCANYLNWLLSTWRSSGSSWSSLRMSQLLTLSLRLSPATLWRKLIMAACIYDLIPSITTQSSWHRWRLDWLGNRKLCLTAQQITTVTLKSPNEVTGRERIQKLFLIAHRCESSIVCQTTIRNGIWRDMARCVLIVY